MNECVSAENNKNLSLIEECLLVLCLDLKPLETKWNRRGARGGKGWALGARDETNLAHQMIHGGGAHVNSSNRWFDKTVQVTSP